MLPLLAIGDILMVQVLSEVAGQTVMNQTYYRCDTAPTAGETYVEQVTTVLGAITADPGPSVIASMLATMAPDALIRSCRAQRIRPTRSPYVEVPVGSFGAIEGTVAAPPVCAASITKRTLAVGRGRSAHWQQGGCPVERIDNGYWQTAFVVGELQELADELEAQIDLITGGLWTPGVQPMGTTGGFEEFLQCVAKDEVRTMHRRTVGLGV